MRAAMRGAVSQTTPEQTTVGTGMPASFRACEMSCVYVQPSVIESPRQTTTSVAFGSKPGVSSPAGKRVAIRARQAQTRERGSSDSLMGVFLRSQESAAVLHSSSFWR